MKKIFLLIPVTALIFMGAGCVSTDNPKQVELDNKIKCNEAANKKIEEIKVEWEQENKNMVYDLGREFSKSRNSCFLKYATYNRINDITNFNILDVYTNKIVVEYSNMFMTSKNLEERTWYMEDLKKFTDVSSEIFGE